MHACTGTVELLSHRQLADSFMYSQSCTQIVSSLLCKYYQPITQQSMKPTIADNTPDHIIIHKGELLWQTACIM